MNTTVMCEPELLGDAQLVSLCLAGHRDAFGQIVARYQSLVCALAYSAFGDLARSEDLAQETFLAAWQQLHGLKEPARLKAWLCGIARNLINDSFRRQTRNPLAQADPIEEGVGHAPPCDTPPERTMSQEEQAILWRVLEGMPRCYREPMVLFYRQEDSVAAVAEAMGLSEEAVRQRLSRGRAMLNERVATLVETGLRRSGPDKTFGLAVLAALPAASVKAGVFGAVTATVKGSGVAKGAGILGVLGAALGTLVPVGGGWAGMWGQVQNTRSPREKKFLARAMWGIVVWQVVSVGTLASLALSGTLHISARLVDTLGWSLVWVGLLGLLLAYCVWMGRRQKQIQTEDGTCVPASEAWGGDPARPGFKLAVYGSLAALILGAQSWLTIVACVTHDRLLLVLLPVFCVGGWLGSASAVLRRPPVAKRVYITVWWSLTLFVLAVVNLRWDFWQGNVPLDQLPKALAPVGLNLLILTAYGSIGLPWWIIRSLVTSRNLKRHGTVAATAWGAVLAGGLGWLLLLQRAEARLPMETQTSIDDIQADGTIRMQSTSEGPNRSGSVQRTMRFCNSDFCHLEKMTDAQGRALAFTVKHENGLFRYTVTLNDPVPPEQMVTLKSEGYLTGQVRPLPSGEFEYSEHHWPANGLPTRRIELLRLPPGATVSHIASEDMQVNRVRTVDGRTELPIEKMIPPGGSISVVVRYRLAKPD